MASKTYLMIVTGFAALCAATAARAVGPTCLGGSIKLGAISTITGPADFSEVPKAAKATYDALNAVGGVNGCKIDYTIADAKADRQVAAQGRAISSTSRASSP